MKARRSDSRAIDEGSEGQEVVSLAAQVDEHGQCDSGESGDIVMSVSDVTRVDDASYSGDPPGSAGESEASRCEEINGANRVHTPSSTTPRSGVSSGDGPGPKRKESLQRAKRGTNASNSKRSVNQGQRSQGGPPSISEPIRCDFDMFKRTVGLFLLSWAAMGCLCHTGKPVALCRCAASRHCMRVACTQMSLHIAACGPESMCIHLHSECI